MRIDIPKELEPAVEHLRVRLGEKSATAALHTLIRTEAAKAHAMRHHAPRAKGEPRKAGGK